MSLIPTAQPTGPPEQRPRWPPLNYLSAPLPIPPGMSKEEAVIKLFDEGEIEIDKQAKKQKDYFAGLRKQYKIARRLENKFRFKSDIHFPDKVLHNRRRPNGATDRFSTLPREILHQIWRELDFLADRGALALTCKTHAVTYEILKKMTIHNAGGGKRFFLPRPKVVTKFYRMRMLIVLRNWMPAKWRLCYRCNQFIDTQNADNKGDWGGSEAEALKVSLGHRAVQVGPRCPLCVTADKMEFASHKREFKQFLQGFKKTKW